MSEPIRLGILESQRLFREALAAVIGEYRDIELVGWTRSRPCSETRELWSSVDIALIDATPDKTSALEWVREMRLSWPRVKLVVLGLERAEQEILKFIEAGANGYVLRESSLDDLVSTLKAVDRGEAICSPRIVHSVFERITLLSRQQRRPPRRALTRREREILQLIARGLSNKEIAGKLAIALYTVKNHVHNILEKFQVPSRQAAILVGHDLGFLDSDWLDGGPEEDRGRPEEPQSRDLWARGERA